MSAKKRVVLCFLRLLLVSLCAMFLVNGASAAYSVSSSSTNTPVSTTPTQSISTTKSAQTPAVVQQPPNAASIQNTVPSSLGNPLLNSGTKLVTQPNAMVTSSSLHLAQTSNYSGGLISLNFQDIKVRAVLELLAQFTGLNIITSDTVTGSVTLHLDNVPWDQALDIILQSQGLGKKQVGNVLLIAPVAELAAHEEAALKAIQEIQDLAPLQSELIQINYGKAADIANLLKGQGSTLLSSRGNVSVDQRTNTIWVQDTPGKLIEIRRLVQELDIPVKQVLIEARIVNVDSSFEEDLGVRWGVTTPGENISGTLEGANQLAQGTAPADIPVFQRLNVDLPATTAAGSTVGQLAGEGPASAAIALAHLGKGTLLDLELSALESEGGGELISSPRLITADQQAAFILQGQEIPYQQASSSGATNVAFKNAVLKLTVIPQITPDGKIILNLKVNQDKVSTLVVQGVPAIDTRQIETQVLVDDGETVVLGGVYETDSKNQLQRVPFFGSLPVFGGLFRNTQTQSKRTELLIFITPHILKACGPV